MNMPHLVPGLTGSVSLPWMVVTPHFQAKQVFIVTQRFVILTVYVILQFDRRIQAIVVLKNLDPAVKPQDNTATAGQDGPVL
jgi:hypothetical protein